MRIGSTLKMLDGHFTQWRRQEIVEDLEVALEQFRKIAEDLGDEGAV